jgi:DNA-binding transcriptional regulator YiaG
VTGPQLAAALSNLGLSQRGGAKFLGVSDRTVRRWIAGTDPVPKAIAMLLVLIVRLGITPAGVQALIDQA